MNIMSQMKQIQMNQPKNWGKFLSSAGKVISCAVSTTTARQEAEIMISEPDKQLAKDIWNLPEKKELKGII